MVSWDLLGTTFDPPEVPAVESPESGEASRQAAEEALRTVREAAAEARRRELRRAEAREQSAAKLAKRNPVKKLRVRIPRAEEAASPVQVGELGRALLGAARLVGLGRGTTVPLGETSTGLPPVGTAEVVGESGEADQRHEVERIRSPLGDATWLTLGDAAHRPGKEVMPSVEAIEEEVRAAEITPELPVVRDERTEGQAVPEDRTVAEQQIAELDRQNTALDARVRAIEERLEAMEKAARERVVADPRPMSEYDRGFEDGVAACASSGWLTFGISADFELQARCPRKWGAICNSVLVRSGKGNRRREKQAATTVQPRVEPVEATRSARPSSSTGVVERVERAGRGGLTR